ncbi:MAG TPA: hypothetical protein VHV30_16395 [Polyangiaceae bacterium]|nr:hypothetical protein [Polyangiaceae bacterium]
MNPSKGPPKPSFPSLPSPALRKEPPKPSKGPAKPPPTAAIGLTEVERAISVLDGRHPEHEKFARETRAAAERRRGEIEADLGRKRRARVLRAVAALVVAGVAGVSGFYAWRLAKHARAMQASIDAMEAPWAARGFSAVTSNLLTSAASLDVDLPGAGCFVALSSSDAPLETTVGGAPATVAARGSVAWCTCGPGHVAIQTPAPGASTALAVMRVDPEALGGAFARSWLAFTPGAWAETGASCADSTLDAWLAGNHLPATEPDAAWLLNDPARAPLRRAGLKPAGAIDPGHPFALAPLKGGTCLLAVAKSPDALSIRATGGARLLADARGALGWCTSAAATFTVWRDGASPVALLAGPAARIGGRQGLRETADGARIALAVDAVGMPDADLAWDAASLLAASGFGSIESAPLRADPTPTDARPIAIALKAGAATVFEPDRTVMACDPALAQLTATPPGALDSICAPGAPVAWFDKTDAPAGAARGVLPVWLTPLEGRHEPDAVARIPELLALTRRLAREGFEATALEGVTELPDGVRVIGRAAEDAVVAIGLAPRPPWALPYSSGVPWDLGDAPRVVPLKPGETVKLVPASPPTAPLNTRRTVVFRRSMSAPH